MSFSSLWLGHDKSNQHVLHGGKYFSRLKPDIAFIQLKLPYEKAPVIHRINHIKRSKKKLASCVKTQIQGNLSVNIWSS